MSKDRLDTLENALQRLAKSQARAWEEIGKLSKSQMDQEARYDRLAESEAKAWEAIGRIADRHDDLAKAMKAFNISTAAAFDRQDAALKELRKLVERFIRAQKNGRN